MQIAFITNGISSLGINSRVGIWTLGCLRNCPGCISPEYQFFDKSKEMTVEEIITKLRTYEFDGVTISGGEPFLWAHELSELVRRIKEEFTDDILIYSGNTLKELVNKHDKDINYILKNIAVLVDGPFIQEQADDILLRGSKNQNIIIFNKKYLEDYKNYLKQEKMMDVVINGNDVHYIGVPIPGIHDLVMQLDKGDK